MPSVRVIHPTLRSCTFAIETAQVYPVPYNCHRCGFVHFNKTLHLDLDQDGAAVMTSGMFERLRSEGILGGLAYANDVSNPPAQQIGVGTGIPGMPPLPARIVQHRLGDPCPE